MFSIHFFSLSRSGLAPITAKGLRALRPFCAALRNCAPPTFYLRRTGTYSTRFCEVGMDLRTADRYLFRCSFALRFFETQKVITQ